MNNAIQESFYSLLFFICLWKKYEKGVTNIVITFNENDLTCSEFSITKNFDIELLFVSFRCVFKIALKFLSSTVFVRSHQYVNV